MKPTASLDKASLTILQCAFRDRIRKPNKTEAKSREALVSEATELLRATHTLPDSIMHEATNRLLLAGCFDGWITYDGKGEVHHAQINSVGEMLMCQIETEERAERRHSEIQTRLEELKRPHWTVRPTFLFTVIGALAAVAAAILGWIALHPSTSVSPLSSSPTQQQAPVSSKP